MSDEPADPFKAIEAIGDVPIAPAHGIAAVALSLALRYHDINTVQDGVLYQQYKMEGRNIGDLTLDRVFETAIRMEAYLLGASERIASIVVDAITADDKDDDDGSGGPERSP